jgi:hypothetical protein
VSVLKRIWRRLFPLVPADLVPMVNFNAICRAMEKALLDVVPAGDILTLGGSGSVRYEIRRGRHSYAGQMGSITNLRQIEAEAERAAREVATWSVPCLCGMRYKGEALQCDMHAPRVRLVASAAF